MVNKLGDTKGKESMRRAHVRVLSSVLLGMSLVGCGGCAPEELKKEEKKQDIVLDEKELQEAAVADLKAKIQRARAGEAVDFDGDGFAEYRQWTEDGVRYVEIKNPEGKVRSFFEIRPDGSEKYTYSKYGDGIIDYQEERNEEKRVELFDTDRAHFFNKSVTSTWIDDPNFFQVLEEELSSDGRRTPVRDEPMPIGIETLTDNPTWEEASFFENPAHAWMGMPENSSGNPFIETIPSEFGIHRIQDGKGRCTGEENGKVEKAFFDIYMKSLKCLEATNPPMADKIKKTLVSDNHHVNFYCGFENNPDLMNPPPGKQRLGNTSVWRFGCRSIFPCTIAINRDYLNHASQNQIQETILHEYLHSLGFDLNNPKHNQGEDKTYACSRYCSGCTQGSIGTPENSSIDCARCADSPNEKWKCGHKNLVPFGEPKVYPYCNSSTQEITEDFLCEGKARIWQYFYCDDTLLKWGEISVPGVNTRAIDEAASRWYCCEECPCEEDCYVKTHDNNSVPCVYASDEKPLPFPPKSILDPDLCKLPPPFCSGKT